jgi:formylglycine-generating enzyme required for sulfatase activity
MSAQDAFSRGTLVDGRYCLLARLGEGTFGDVWRAEDTRLANRTVAVKFLKAEFLTHAEAVARFEAEADALAQLQHANVVGVLDRGRWAGQRFLVTEFVAGGSLTGWLDAHRARGVLPEIGLVMILLDQVCAGLAAAHAVRAPGAIVHRDIKPDNVLVRTGADGEVVVKIVDFGIAQLGGRAGTRTGALMGTPLYMAPEQALGNTAGVGPWTDVFALGVLATELLTLRPQVDANEPWWGTALQRGPEVRSLLGAMRRDVPAAVWDVLAGALRARGDERPVDAGALRSALRPAWTGGSAGVAPLAPTVLAPSMPLPSPAPSGMPLTEQVDRTVVSLPPVVVQSTTAPLTREAHPGARTPARGNLAVAVLAGALLLVGATALIARSASGSRTDPAPPSTVAASTPGSAPPSGGSPGRSTRPLAPGAPQDCPGTMAAIPSGTFVMGTPEGDGAEDEHPPHQVQVTGFCIDRTEVTVARYASCVAAGGCAAPSTLPSAGAAWQDVCNGIRSDRMQHPVNCVTWTEAMTFCRWAGGRLPTESEWEYAAKGGDEHRFPWGDEAPTSTRANACGTECRRAFPASTAMYESDDHWPATAPVGSFPAGANPFGLLDMAGNVAEWTSDRYGRYPVDTVADPTGPVTGSGRATRGGGWLNGGVGALRAAFRDQNPISYRGRSVGFRCVRPAPRQ